MSFQLDWIWFKSTIWLSFPNTRLWSNPESSTTRWNK